MSRFVIVLTESYDQFDAKVPHPIETRHSKDELRAAIESHLGELRAWRERQNPTSTRDPSPPYTLTLLDTGMEIDAHEFAYPNTTAGDFGIVCFDILTTDEWFAEYGNRRFNSP